MGRKKEGEIVRSMFYEVKGQFACKFCGFLLTTDHLGNLRSHLMRKHKESFFALQEEQEHQANISEDSAETQEIVPVKDPVAKPLDEALNLLVSWDLESLCESFQEQQVCTKAFMHLTDADIIELVPKIGPRAIFRSHLLEWREQQGFNAQSSIIPHIKTSIQQQEPIIPDAQSPMVSNNKTALQHQERNYQCPNISQLARKQKDSNIQTPIVSNFQTALDQREHNVQSPIVPHVESSQTQNELNIQSPTVSHHDFSSQEDQELNIRNPIVILNCDNADTTTVSVKQELPDVSPSVEPHAENIWETVTKEEPMFENNDSRTLSITSGYKGDYSEPSENESTLLLDVRSVLNTDYEGQIALEYYKENNCLDMHHRKKVVKAIIASALEQRMDFSVNDFHTMTMQLLQLFPKESYDTFYTPRVGNIRARGMLYNKYVNLARTMRKEGRLEYRRQFTHRSILGHDSSTLKYEMV